MLLSISTLGLLTISQTISSSGTITAVNVGVFSDSQCTQPLSSISWGTISPDSSVSSTIYLKNTGNVPLTLNMTTSSWNPTIAGNSITITWNRENTLLGADQSTPALYALQPRKSINLIVYSIKRRLQHPPTIDRLFLT
jgi:hypothetical protein